MADDRHKDLIIDEFSELGPAPFSARKQIFECAKLAIRNVTAIYVCEHGTEKYGKVKRFLYTVPEHVQDRWNTSLAVQKARMDTITLFSGV